MTSQPTSQSPDSIPAANSGGAPADPPQTRRRFFEKLSFYVTGLAIGFVMVGLINKGREASLRRREAEEAAKAGITAPQDPKNPPIPAAAPPAVQTPIPKATPATGH